MAQVSAAELNSAVSRITNILEECGIRYHLTGGIASTYWGDPRYTQDVDIVVTITKEQADELKRQLAADFFVSPENIYGEKIFQALDNKTFVKVDFHVGEAIPNELSRSNTVEVLPGITCNVVSIEDAIVSKLRWLKLGSHKSKDDVIGMLASEHTINRERLESLCNQLDLKEILDQIESDQ